MGHLGFSYVGLLFMLMLFIPNIMWAKRQPQGYSAENENKILLMLERVGEVLATCCALFFSDFNLHGISKWSLWLAAAFILMIMYEIWWVRYFKSFGHSGGRRHAASACVFSAGHLWKSYMDADCKHYFGNRAYWDSFAAFHLWILTFEY